MEVMIVHRPPFWLQLVSAYHAINQGNRGVAGWFCLFGLSRLFG
jgi:hypothetical protein